MKFSSTVIAAVTILGATNNVAFAAPTQPISDFVTVTLVTPTNVDHDFDSQEQNFLASAIVKAYGKTHDNIDQLDLDSVAFESQHHERAVADDKSGSLRSAIGKSYEFSTMRFFPKWTCNDCSAFPAFLEDFVSDSETLKQHGGSCGPKCRPDDDELELTATKTAHEAWERKLCKILGNSDFAVFSSAQKCKITFDSAEYVQQHGGSCGPKCRPDDDELVEEPVAVGMFQSMVDYLKQHGGSCGPKCRPDDDELVEEVPEPVEDLKQHGGSCGPKCRPDDDELVEEVPEPVVEDVKQHGGSCGPKCRPDDDELKEVPIAEQVEELVEKVEELVDEIKEIENKDLKQHGGSCGPKCRPDDDELKEEPIVEKEEPIVEKIPEPVEETKDLKQHGGSCGPKCRPDDDELELKKD